MAAVLRLVLHSETASLRFQLLGSCLDTSCLCVSVSQAPVDRGTIILCSAQCSARPNFAPPFASDRALSVLTAPQSHWDLSAFPPHPAPLPRFFYPPCTFPKTHRHTLTTSFTDCLLKGQAMEMKGGEREGRGR